MNLSFDLATMINTFVSAVVGGIISFVISYFFFLKGKGVEILTRWLTSNLSDLLIRQQHPQFFGPNAVHLTPNLSGPPNGDIPRLSEVLTPHHGILPGGKLEILFRVSDTGWNFPTSAGVTITDHHGLKGGVQDAGFGFMKIDIMIPQSDMPGSYQLTFDMHDVDSNWNPINKFTQSVNFQII